VAAPPDADRPAGRVARQRRPESGEHVVDRLEVAAAPIDRRDLAPLRRGQDRDRPARRRGERGGERQEAHEGAAEGERGHSAIEALQRGQFKGTPLATARRTRSRELDAA
jgi:hypothetical protein